MTSENQQRRLFFALWPAPGIRGEIVERRKYIDGLSKRRVPDHNLHLTLLFLGNQPADRLDEIIAAARTVRAGGFEMVLDRFGWFARARVAWLGGPAPAPGKALVAQLNSTMSGLGLRFDDRAWAPHVTLFRQVGSKPILPEIEPISWPVKRFELIESMPGKPYASLMSVALN